MCVCVGRVRLCVCVWLDTVAREDAGCLLIQGLRSWHLRVCMCLTCPSVCVCVCVCVWLAGYSGWRRCRLSSQLRLRRLASTCVYVLDVSVCVCVCVCGWTQWLEKMQVVYSSKAQEAGVYVLEACGFDSIPAEMALLHATKQFDGRCHCLTHT